MDVRELAGTTDWAAKTVFAPEKDGALAFALIIVSSTQSLTKTPINLNAYTR